MHASVGYFESQVKTLSWLKSRQRTLRHSWLEYRCSVSYLKRPVCHFKRSFMRLPWNHIATTISQPQSASVGSCAGLQSSSTTLLQPKNEKNVQLRSLTDSISIPPQGSVATFVTSLRLAERRFEFTHQRGPAKRCVLFNVFLLHT